MKILTVKPFALLCALVLVAGCSSTPEQGGEEAAEGALVESRDAGDGASTHGAGTQGASTLGAAGQGEWSGSALDDPSSPLSTRAIYFDFDSSDIRSEYVDILRAHAQYLIVNPTARLVLEGHGDERGTREYNLALGERRTRVVKQFLMAEGASGTQLDDISYGEERPVDTDQGEDAWARNRRVELLY